MHDCCHFNKDSTPIDKSGGAARPQPKEKRTDGVSFAQLILSEVSRAFHTTTTKILRQKKHCTNHSDSNNDSNYRIALRNYIHVRKLNEVAQLKGILTPV